ncbi:sulfatase-like hydrolase/transferase [Pontiella sulfatireligans]|uniref:Arylsulfatase n=1 Tax=Pontiella sulfatireligans TaxID=2750658 RepID=A0A6C2UGV9_9BACT|nr:sulfatase-like hydrolase/transferase [Pontiella sulfatireligans]SPS74214.1 sulfatase S1_7 [Kiritimatiellales bacterium]VGO18651.1 Arylsulfatase [Pontiella sulfatireligans]
MRTTKPKNPFRNAVIHVFAGLSVLCVFPSFGNNQAQGKLNVLFIGVDDLRPLLNCYGETQMITPNIDRLAKQGLMFNRAYVQQAICSASRACLLTGCRPDTTGVDYPYPKNWFEDFVPEHTTIPTFFTQNGYYTRTLGKIHHGKENFDRGLTEANYRATVTEYKLPENESKYMVEQPNGKKKRTVKNVKPWEHADVEDAQFIDGQMTQETIATIRRAVKQDKPFFIAPGFTKPHLPFVCPKKYYDLYNPEELTLSPHPVRNKENQPDFTIAGNSGPIKWWNFQDGIDDDNARQLIHSYYACVSFIDAQVGLLLDELERQGIMDKTIIVFWSDHGWHLGDHGNWGKATNYELATRSPLIVSVPQMTSKGQKTDALVEYVDLYPTLTELAGLEAPDWLEGNSFVPLLDDPAQPWKRAAFSQYPRGSKEGYSVRTEQWRYTEWRDQNGKIVFQELYNSEKDPIEAKNLAPSPEYKDQLAAMKKVLDEGWKQSLPPERPN